MGPRVSDLADAPDPAHPMPKFSPPRRVPHGVTLIGKLFDEGTTLESGPGPRRGYDWFVLKATMDSSRLRVLRDPRAAENASADPRLGGAQCLQCVPRARSSPDATLCADVHSDEADSDL